jgi:hypothetical protein
MWDDIERAVEGFKKTDRARLAEGAKIFGPMASFPGFCGNYETEHLTASGFLVQKLGRFERFFDRDLNSHIPLVDAYRRMLALFDPMRSGLSGRHLTFDEVISLCQAAVHPDHR